MSLTQNRARFSVLGGPRFYFTGWTVQGGSLATRFVRRLEKLSTPGVDSARFRLVNSESPDLDLLLWDPLVSGMGIGKREGEYAKANGYRGTLELDDVDGATLRWDNTTVTGIQVAGRFGPLAGYGAQSGSSNTLIAVWSFYRAQEAS
jgi:hypothetical protein